MHLDRVSKARTFTETVETAASYWKAHSAFGTEKSMFTCALACSLPVSIGLFAREFFRNSAEKHLGHPSVESAVDESMSVATHAEITEFARICNLAQETGLMALLSETIVGVIVSVVDDCIQGNIGGVFDSRLLHLHLRWNETRIYSWLHGVLGSSKPVLDSYRSQIRFHIYTVFCDIRVDELFDIFVEYPASEPALNELKICVHKTDRYQYLKSAAKEIISYRLLHLGAKTSQIVSVYVSAIKCLNLLDPTGDLLNSVSEIIKKYLRTRSDAMKSVINLLTGDSNEMESIDIEAMDEGVPDETREIIIARHAKTKVLDHAVPADITTNLVQIFDSPDIFIREFQTLLAERLIAKTDFETDRELKNLEMLKKYFPEAKLHQCDVMLRDMADSKRINANIHKTVLPDQQPHFTMKILSRLFWPNFNYETNTLPACFKLFLDSFSGTFSQLKSMRTLRHLTSYGTVTLDLELEDRTLTFTVTPSQASVIGFFHETGSWSLPQLETASGLNAGALEKILLFWIGKGVLRKEGDMYMVLEIADENFKADVMDSEDAEVLEQSQAAPSSVQISEKMKPFLAFISGMMTNLGAMPVERIHAMLSQYALSPKYEGPIDILRAYLGILMEEDVVECTNGVYGLRKK
ncbi:Anaphase-promoting complex subunit 2 [Chytriomyces hyalinus]|nr:Anaphase-promoting complex subunit 2 [Chytriomyces hyalinus]